MTWHAEVLPFWTPSVMERNVRHGVTLYVEEASTDGTWEWHVLTREGDYEGRALSMRQAMICAERKLAHLDKARAG